MSIERVTALVCDVCGCAEGHGYTARKARREAKADGWKVNIRNDRYGRKDVCKDCLEELRVEKVK